MKIQNEKLMAARPILEWAWLFCALFLSRLVYYHFFGLRFNSTPLYFFVQYIDPDLLRKDLLRSLYYLHDQPPLFNLFLGLVLKASPLKFELVFQILYLLIGGVLTASLHWLLRKMSVQPAIALILATAYAVAPSTAQYENWLFYTYPVTALFCLSAVFLHKYASGASSRDGIIFFSLLATISLTRGIFPLLWYVFSVCILLDLMKIRRKKILLHGAGPFIILLAFSLKQYFLFGQFGTGQAFVGQNLAHRMAVQIPADLKKTLQDEGKISPIIFYYPHQAISGYKDFLKDLPHTGIPILDSENKSTGVPNNHNLGYIRLAPYFRKDVVYLLITYPKIYLQSFRVPLHDYFMPSGDDFWALDHQNSPALRDLYRFFNFIYCGQVKEHGVGWLLVMILPLLLSFGSWRAIREIREIKRKDGENLPFSITLVFALFNIIYVAAITVPITWGDYNRYRFKVDPFYLLLLGIALTSLLSWRQGLKR